MSMLRRICMFPGQGSQFTGMFKDLLRAWPSIVKPVFQEAEEALKFPLHATLGDSDIETLSRSANAQVAVMAHSVAVLRILEHYSDTAPSLLAGHSLGEITAACAGESFEFRDAIRLARVRGLLMDEASRSAEVGDSGDLCMLAVFPVDHDTLFEALRNAKCSSCGLEPWLDWGAGVQSCVAALNADNQVVLSGRRCCHNAVIKEYKALKGRKGRVRTKELQVGGPFHSPVMAPVEAGLAGLLRAKGEVREYPVPDDQTVIDLLESMDLKPTLVEDSVTPMVTSWSVRDDSDVTQIRNGVDVRESLLHSVCHTVDWKSISTELIDTAFQHPVVHILEIGGGNGQNAPPGLTGRGVLSQLLANRESVCNVAEQVQLTEESGKDVLTDKEERKNAFCTSLGCEESIGAYLRMCDKQL